MVQARQRGTAYAQGLFCYAHKVGVIPMWGKSIFKGIVVRMLAQGAARAILVAVGAAGTPTGCVASGPTETYGMGYMSPFRCLVARPDLLN